VIGGRASRVVLRLIVGTLLCLTWPVPTLQAATTVRVGTYTNEPLVFRDAKGVHQEAGVITVCPAGSLSSNTYTILEERLAQIREARPRVIVFDLKDLTYISSAGVRIFVMVKKALKATGGTVALTNLQPQIRKVFEIIQPLPSLNIFESVEELDRYLAAMQRKVREGEAE